MRFKPRVWEPIAWILSGANVIAAWFAAVPGESWHATTHAALAVGFALWAQNLRRQGREEMPDALIAARLGELEARLAEFDHIQDVAARLAELEERVDFAERTLVEVRQTRIERPPARES